MEIFQIAQIAQIAPFYGHTIIRQEHLKSLVAQIDTNFKDTPKNLRSIQGHSNSCLDELATNLPNRSNRSNRRLLWTHYNKTRTLKMTNRSNRNQF